MENKFIPTPTSQYSEIIHLNGKRNLEMLENELRTHLKERDYFAIGKLLNESKVLFGDYGNWKKWLRDNFNLSYTSAARFMRVAKAVENLPTLASFGYAKIDILIRLNEKRIDEFIENNDINALSVRELEDCVRKQNGENKKYETKTKRQNSALNEFDKIEVLREKINDLLVYLEKNTDDSNKFEAVCELKNACENAINEISKINNSNESNGETPPLIEHSELRENQNSENENFEDC